ncbi:MAG: DnaJ domain-containing protein [Bradyrhizobium sp.]|jgi:curved DNA-binding protein CbpA
MKTLYELLGALPHDDAEALRSAFRKAVKGAHPDLRPGDPDAALKFRQIVRANQILCDAEEREAYDHLLELAHLEQVSASKKAAAAKVHRLASGVIALTGASVVTVSGYLLFIHLSAASIASISNVSASMRSWPELAPLAAGSADLQKSAPELGQNASISDARGAQNSDLTEAETENVFHVQFGGNPEFPGSEARAWHVRGDADYRHGDLKEALADLDRAIQRDAKYLPAYIDHGIIFYRQRKFERAFADIARTRRVEKPARSKPGPRVARTHRFERGARAPVPFSHRHIAEQDLSGRGGG